MFLLMTSPSPQLVWQLTTATKPYLAVIFAALVSVVESAVALTVVTTDLAAVVDAVQEPLVARDESVNTFMILVVLSPLKKVHKCCCCVSRHTKILRIVPNRIRYFVFVFVTDRRLACDWTLEVL